MMSLLRGSSSFAFPRMDTNGNNGREAPPAKRQRTATNEAPSASAVIDLTASPSPPPSPEHPTQRPTTPSAVGFRLTKLQDAPPSHNDYAVGLTDLLSGEFTECLLTNYMFDMPWLFHQCPRLHDVPVVLVHGERDQAAMANECRGYSNVKLVAPRLPIPYGTHHTKMMVLIFETSVRVAIFTANFIPIDWNNKTQGVWTQDFPRKHAATSNESATSSSCDVVDFERDLLDYLSKLGKPVADFCSRLRRFDFSSADVALVASVPGVHTGKDMDKYGHLRVRTLLQHFNAPRTDHPLICQFSSMGSLDEKWLFGEFSTSLMGGQSALASATPLPIKSFHIIWPSVSDVRNSIEGWNAGRAVPCPLKNMKPFLHKYLRKWTPPPLLHRQNAMPHIKSYARFHPSQDGRLDWALLTSSNLSKAAWGAYQKNKTQFLVRSYELGVLFVPKAGSSTRIAVVGSASAAVATDAPSLVQLPLPYSFPIKTYDPTQDEPWVWDRVREDPDIYGNCYIPR